MKKYRKILFELLRFILVGGTAAGIQYVCFYLLNKSYNHYVSFITSYLISFVYNCICTIFFTFKVEFNWIAVVKFVSGHICNFVIQWLFLLLFRLWLSNDMAMLCSMLLAFPINFVIIRFLLTFKKNIYE